MKGCMVLAGTLFVYFFYGCSGYGVTFADVMAKLGRHQKLNEVKAYIESEAKDEIAKTNQIAVLRLVGGSDSCRGRLELNIDGAFHQTCDLNFGTEEAKALCSDLGCNQAQAQRVDPVQFGFSTAINLYVAFGFNCAGGESTILQCQGVGAVCVTDSPRHAIALDCGGPRGQELQLVGSLDRCEGRLVTLRNGLYGQACDLNANDAMARVVCRQLGCNPTGAQRTDPVQFGFTAAIGRYHIVGVQCSGSESNINQCSQVGGNCASDSVPHAIAIRCGQSLASN